MSSTDFDGIVPGDHHDAWYVSKAVWGATVACFFAMAAILIATGQIYHHLRHYHEPVVQRYTIRILLMVPIYAFDSCVSLFTYKTIVAFIMTLLRDIYEAYTLYNFLALMLCYLGGANVLVSKWREDMHSPKEGGNSSDDPEDLSNVFSWWTMTCCLKSMLTIDINNPMFLRMIKAGVLQYIFVKIFLAIFALVMECLDLYHEGQFRIKGGFLYFVIIQNISIFISLYSLVVFYLATKKYLAPFKPVIKFAMIKLIIFVTFWQGAVIAFLFFLQVLEPIKGLTKGASSVFMQNFLICIEAVPLAGLVSSSFIHSFFFLLTDLNNLMFFLELVRIPTGNCKEGEGNQCSSRPQTLCANERRAAGHHAHVQSKLQGIRGDRSL